MKEAAGKALGDEQLRASGVSDQVSGTLQTTYGKVRDFARERPFATAVVGGVFAIALLNTLRGK